jgi:hypothetical protein
MQSCLPVDALAVRPDAPAAPGPIVALSRVDATRDERHRPGPASSGAAMHFDIEAIDTELPIEARAYFEFRVFSALTRLGTDVFAVRAVVRRSPRGAPPGIDCRVQVLLHPAGDATLDVRADRLYAAIDAVADAIAPAVQQAMRRSALAAGGSARSA